MLTATRQKLALCEELSGRNWPHAKSCLIGTCHMPRAVWQELASCEDLSSRSWHYVKSNWQELASFEDLTD
jgi:hypothetical protein